MSLIKAFLDTILTALFPFSNAEKELFSYSPEQAYDILPKSLLPPIARAYSVFAYKDPRVTKLVWNIKYKKSLQAATIGAYALHRMLGELKIPLKLMPDEKILILPMPITAKRRQERGYNQCEIIANELKKFDSSNRLEIVSNLLLRIHHTSRQTLKDRKERLMSAKGIFSINEDVLKKFSSDELIYRTVIIIDDVITTGSTIKEAMETVQTAGFGRVYGLSVAH